MANDGSLIPRGRGKWEVQLSLGKDPVTGKYRKVSRTVNGTKAEARKVRDQLRRELDDGVKLDAGKVTLSEFIETWADAKRIAGNASERTINVERRSLRHVEKHLGSVPINAIDPQMIESVYSKIKTETGLSGSTLNHIHIALKNVFKKAVDYDFILRNPCERVEAPRRDSVERRALDADEAARLLWCVDAEEARAYGELSEKEARQMERGKAFGRTFIRGMVPVSYVLAVRIGLATGMRRGEVFGLTWGCIDFESKRLSVRQSVTNEGTVKPPKTRAGIRSVAIDGETARHLSAWKARQAVELRKFGVKQSDDTPVCCSNTGGYAGLANFEHWWSQFRKRNDFDGLKFHELRHTQATQLLANGVDVKTVQTRMRHANAALTLNWYAHAVPENDDKAAQLVGDLFKAKPPEPRIIEVKTA